MSSKPQGARAPVIDDEKEHSADEIRKLIEKHGSLTCRNISVRGDLEIEYETKVHELSFENVHFIGAFEISGSKGELNFQEVIFEREADFYLSKPEKLDFNECEFKAVANFHSVETTEFWLNKSRFRDQSTFVNMKVKELLNLADVVFEKSVDFSGARVGEVNSTRLRSTEPIQIRWAQFGKIWVEQFYEWALAEEDDERISRLRQFESHLRFWKQNFVSLGQKADELDVNYEVERLRRTYFTRMYGFRWWVSVLLEIPSRYGTRPFRPVLIGFLVILIFGFLYWLVNPFVALKPTETLPNKPFFLFSLFYSLDTFVPVVNITGVKDWGWSVANAFRWIVVIERVLGLSISVLAAYSISQTFSFGDDQ